MQIEPVPGGVPIDAQQVLLWQTLVGPWRPWAGIIPARQQPSGPYLAEAHFDRVLAARALGWPRVAIGLTPDVRTAAENIFTKFLPSYEIFGALALASLARLPIDQVVADLCLPPERPGRWRDQPVRHSKRLLQRFSPVLVACIASRSDGTVLDQLMAIEPAPARQLFGSEGLRKGWTQRRANAFRTAAARLAADVKNGHPVDLRAIADGDELLVRYLLVLLTTKNDADDALTEARLDAFRQFLTSGLLDDLAEWEDGLHKWIAGRLQFRQESRAVVGSVSQSVIEARFDEIATRVNARHQAIATRPNAPPHRTSTERQFRTLPIETIQIPAPPSAHVHPEWAEAACLWWASILRPLTPWAGVFASDSSDRGGSAWAYSHLSAWFRLEAAKRLGWSTVYVTGDLNGKAIPVRPGLLAQAFELARERNLIAAIEDDVAESWGLTSELFPWALGFRPPRSPAPYAALDKYDDAVQGALILHGGLVETLGNLAHRLLIIPRLVPVEAALLTPDTAKVLNGVARMMLQHRWPDIRADRWCSHLLALFETILSLGRLEIGERIGRLLIDFDPRMASPWLDAGASLTSLAWSRQVWAPWVPAEIALSLDRCVAFYNTVSTSPLETLPVTSGDLVEMVSHGASIRGIALVQHNSPGTIRRRLKQAGLRTRGAHVQSDSTSQQTVIDVP